MDICHGVWAVPATGGFDNPGRFLFWVETSRPERRNGSSHGHPTSLASPDRVRELLTSGLGLSKPAMTVAGAADAKFSAVLPTDNGQPLPSLEMAQLTGEYLPETCAWKTWEIRAVEIARPLAFLRELELVFGHGVAHTRPGYGLQFWIRFARQVRNVVRQHQFLPVMKARRIGTKGNRVEVLTGWAPVARHYEDAVQAFAQAMPAVCAVHDAGTSKGSRPAALDPVELLRHFSEQQVETLVADARFPNSFLNRIRDSWLVHALEGSGTAVSAPASGAPSLADLEQWQVWYDRIVGRTTREAGFVLGVRLDEVKEGDEGTWRLSFFVSSGRDPSLRLDLADWWALSDADKGRWLKEFGDQFEHDLLLGLGHAARMCPLLWQGMDSARPTGLGIDLDTAYEFLKNDALVLESSGFRIVLPSWWTPEGRRRARVRIKAAGRSAGATETVAGTGVLTLDSLVDYNYDLSIDGEPVSEEEWLALVDAKSPLVRFRGEWMEINGEHLSRMLEMWRQKDDDHSIEFNRLLKDIAESDEDSVVFELDQVLNATLQGLQNQDAIEAADDPPGLQGSLRPYQKKGLAWLAMQERLGLNPCLADDMGLGKTIQLIALLLRERHEMHDDATAPTLLIAPTSVLSNWKREVGRFAPGLSCVIHHGSDRARDAAAFAAAIDGADLIVTSFTLARSDRDLLKSIDWHRVVVDEAQNIKNPRSAQARAICALQAPHRIAMTGTPVENRLMDLWSLFNFLNPGYLGTIAQFRRAYEAPVQRESDVSRGRQLQRLVRPFILRRLKTDKSIINDLPDKVEQKLYCNLTREQASLYQAVVDDVQRQIKDVESMHRRGLILSTLMKLKQICNHPSQFLQDGSAFDASRSHKLTRLNEMVEEALDGSDSLLVFTQFTDVGHRLEALLRERHDCPVHYLHGGTSRNRREKMIESFQDPESPPGIFVLSLRAGGVGITLTRANHVFHFDRWWNPAVENQATDRAYRIGQEKTVFAHKMVVLGTLEERIDAMIEQKQALAENIVGADEDWLTEMDDEAFRDLITLNRQLILET